jgi:hypothetical protein
MSQLVPEGLVPAAVADFLGYVRSGDANYRNLYGLLTKLELYTLRIDLDSGFDINPEVEYARLDYNDLRKELSKSFKDLSYYHSVLNLLKVHEKPDQAMGDAMDDLCDIVMDVTESEQAFLANDESNGLWSLRFSFDTHWAEHLIAIKAYLLNLFNDET